MLLLIDCGDSQGQRTGVHLNCCLKAPETLLRFSSVPGLHLAALALALLLLSLVIVAAVYCQIVEAVKGSALVGTAHE